MSSPSRSGLPTFWTTHLAKVLVGDQPCRLAPWLAGHLNLRKMERDSIQLAEWKKKHTAFLKATSDQMSADGWACSLERYFRVQGSTAVVSGKADLIIRKTDKRPVIIDVKTGYAKESDIVQVCIEMLLMPLAWGSPQMLFAGRVIYLEASPVEINPATAQTYREPLFRLIKELATRVKPEAQPSESTCRFCDVSEDDCPQRWKPADVPVTTTEF